MVPTHCFEDVPALLPSPRASWEDQHRRDGNWDHHLQAEEMRRSDPLTGTLIYTGASPTVASESALESYPSAFHSFQGPTRQMGYRQTDHSEYGSEQRPAWTAFEQRSVGSASFPTSYQIPIEVSEAAKHFQQQEHVDKSDSQLTESVGLFK